MKYKHELVDYDRYWLVYSHIELDLKKETKHIHPFTSSCRCQIKKIHSMYLGITAECLGAPEKTALSMILDFMD